MAFTFKKTLENVQIGKSLFDEDGAKNVAELVKKAKAKGVELVFPVDYITGDKFAKDAQVGHTFLRSISCCCDSAATAWKGHLDACRHESEMLTKRLHSLGRISDRRSRYPRNVDGTRRRTRISKIIRRNDLEGENYSLEWTGRCIRI